MSKSLQKSIDFALSQMLDKVKPKARYISELHVDEYNDSIYKQIINGDIEIPKQRQSVDKNRQQKHGFQEMLRKKLMSQIEKERQNLEHKLGYISNSINSMKKYDQVRGSSRSPNSLRQSYTMGALRSKSEEWREQIKEREKQIEERKKKVEQEKRKKQEQSQQMEKRKKEEENERKKKQIIEKMQTIEKRMKNREEFVKQGNQRYLKAKKEKSLYEKISEDFEEKQKSFLDQQKKKLSEIRSLKRSIDENEIKEHEAKFMQLKRQKEELRERERKMNHSRSKTYKPMYESMFYKQVLEDEKNEVENPAIVKTEKMKQFSLHVKENFLPSIDQKKRQQIQQLLQSEKRKQVQKQEKEKELLEMSKIKGFEYLELIRNIPKKKKDETAHAAPQSDRIKYHNYLTHHSDKNPSRQGWSNILNSSQDKESKALKMQFESIKKQQELKRRQQQTRLLKKGDSSKIDQEYFNMIRAKIEFLKQ